MENYLTAEISAGAIRHNLGVLRRLLQPRTQLCAVVKANCYGHGTRTLLPLLAQGADCLAVATPAEALLLRKLGYDGPVLMFFSACAYTEKQEMAAALAELVARHVTLTVVAEDEVPLVAKAAELVGAPAEVHVMIDTGMTRSGVRPEKAPGLIERLIRTPQIRLMGLYTHFAVADEADKSFTLEQLRVFRDTVATCGGGDGGSCTRPTRPGRSTCPRATSTWSAPASRSTATPQATDCTTRWTCARRCG